MRTKAYLQESLLKRITSLAKNSLKRLKSRNSGQSPFMCDNPKYANFSVGKFSYGTPRVIVWENDTTLTIGKFCSIAGGRYDSTWR